VDVIGSGGRLDELEWDCRPNPWSTYYTAADPITPDQTGKRHFYSDPSGVIRYNASTSATSADAPLQ